MHVNNKKIERNSSPKYQHVTYIERTKRKGKEVYFYGILQSSKEEKMKDNVYADVLGRTELYL